MPGRLGVALVIAGAVAGLLASLLAGSGPGALLGISVLAATAAAAFAVERGAVYRIIPVPALAYAVAALAAALVHGQAAGTSITDLAVSAAQWLAGGFLAVIAATALAVVVTVARRPRGRLPHLAAHPQPARRGAEAGRLQGLGQRCVVDG